MADWTMKRGFANSFTLVELMAAMAVLALLMVALVGMFDQAMRGWRNAQKGIDGRREVRAALQLIERDLRSMVVGTNAPFFTELSSGMDKGQKARIYFMTTLPRNAQDSWKGGDLCGVGYYLQWKSELNEGRGAYALIRYQQSAEGLQTRLRNWAQVGNLRDGDREVFFPESGDGITTETLALNVAHLQTEIFFWSASGSWDYRSGDRLVHTNRPGFIAVNLGAYDPSTARSFSSQADWTSSNNVQKYLRTYFWRVVP